MKILLATGIYPPDIGGPATYVRNLAEGLVREGVQVTVVTYAQEPGDRSQGSGAWDIVHVRKGMPILRWVQFARALKKHGKDADVVYAFSSVSCGVPLLFARLKKPKKVLRLGGDFLWERFTDRGGMLSLRAYYTQHPRLRRFMQRLLKSFDHLVFSTRFQQELYKEHYTGLPRNSVIENALPNAVPEHHQVHQPLRLLFLGRLVRFKNLELLLQAMVRLPLVRLTIVGSGPEGKRLQSLSEELHIESRVFFVAPTHGQEKTQIFTGHDLLVLPSLTEISPHTALEARAAGLPVLLTQETGLSEALRSGMVCADLSGVEQIVAAVANVRSSYQAIAQECVASLEERPWSQVVHEHVELFSSL
ncbi:hypothetical protein COU80_05350 [Candidatus Peregrinibacteria bacterium CG10_big_fil_rev_8_21_14_0_10_55_24]|nr:MAG: hypothetical protein COU80_05350 [Candidatus Peregrinibacteria bacterium CG10_big_fil_rev_8_21_14_0_10_55_24]